MPDENGLLVLSRGLNQSLIIDGPCEVVVVRIGKDKVRLGVRADRSVSIDRKEIWVAKRRDAGRGE